MPLMAFPVCEDSNKIPILQVFLEEYIVQGIIKCHNKDRLQFEK
ncbi:hypothetical protein HMPREF9148_02546 [Prevotella sp. F0091]|nr:hypothetical protein HMPREF9148_02546 [Prevotella sp. F0091]